MNEPSSFRSLSSELAHRVEAFEAALAMNPNATFDHLLPERSHPLYFPLLGELIRVDLEYSWTNGTGKRLADYAVRYPVVVDEPVLLRVVAFEEYRQRRWAGENVPASEYRESFGLDTTDWPSFAPGDDQSSPSNVLSGRESFADPVHTPFPTGRAGMRAMSVLARPEECKTGRVEVRPIEHAAEPNSQMLSRWQQAAESLPAAGTTFLGFRLVEELGRGAFGRVYLARQGDLAGRPVALKVACDVATESQTLAQMQHTNIVPIYSFHRVGPFQAVCMPYFGRTTLAHVVRHISGRPVLPSSGRELRSTLNMGNEPTTVVTERITEVHTLQPNVAAPTEPPAPAPEPAETDPTPAAHDGWAKLEGLSYIEVILTLGGQLADGLAHAHRRGILHRDLKPANVLLTDDGRPMLLDFNLAEDVKQRTATERAAVGGTLPYMAPEHIEVYRTCTGRLDERCDLFSLGVILFELLTGRHPFPLRKGTSKDVILAMIADRQQNPPLLRLYNADVSPAVESLVRKCLAPNPADRYQSAEDLREDIDRHLAHRPLKHAANPSRGERVHKWMKRHPRLTSSASVAAVAAALLIAVIAGAAYARERSRGLEARGRFAEHQIAFRDAQSFLDDRNRLWPHLNEGLGRLHGLLDRYGVPDDPQAADDWLQSSSLRYLPEAERERVKQDVGEAFYLMAQVACLRASRTTDEAEKITERDRAAKWNELAGRYGAERLPRALREQRAWLAELRGDRAGAEQLHREAAETQVISARDSFLLGSQLARSNKHREALPHLERATQLDPENHSAWFLRGSSHLALEEYDLAAVSFGACVSLRPDSALAWLNRGIAFKGMRRLHKLAKADLEEAIRLRPNLIDAYLVRADLRVEDGDWAGAEQDYTLALEAGAAKPLLYFRRANARNNLGKVEGAKADREMGFKLQPVDEWDWLAVAEQRAHDQDLKGALAAVDESLGKRPDFISGMQMKAYLLGERMNRADDALAVLNRAVELNPDHVETLAGRAVALARAGKRDAAHKDAQEAERRDTRPPNLYQLACVYALTAKTHPDDKHEALRLLWGSLRKGPFAFEYLSTDRDLDALRQDADFQKLVKDAEALRDLQGPRGASAGAKK